MLLFKEKKILCKNVKYRVTLYSCDVHREQSVKKEYQQDATI